MKNINNKIKLVLFTFLLTVFFGNFLPAEDFFNEAKKKYDQKKFEDSKFLLQRNIVYNPKDAKSYLYLAKIYKTEENKKEQIKNINTTLLLDPNNEEAMYMLINYELEKSNYSKVKDLKKKFTKICNKLCDKIKKLQDSLKDIEPKNES